MTVATLPSGLLMVHRHCAGATEFCGVTAGVGSRDELTPGRYGLAHFVEHTLFKGTSRRSDSYVLNRMEAVGGELNAYTTKEHTCFYARTLDSHLDQGLDILEDMLFHSKFDPADTQVERGVILEGIGLYADTPGDLVAERLSAAVYKGSPLARPILGRLVRSRSPPQPKRITTRPLAKPRTAASTFSMASGVTA